MIKKYPLLSRILHWLTALLVIGLFFSGWYMVQLDYYSPWYQKLPQWHIFSGFILSFLWTIVLLRLPLVKNSFKNSYSVLEQVSARLVKNLFYLLVLIMIVSGYLIATADGDGVLLFDYLKIPAISHFSATQIDTIGLIHQYTSYFLIFLVCFHILGAMKHHFIDKDETLKRML